MKDKNKRPYIILGIVIVIIVLFWLFIGLPALSPSLDKPVLYLYPENDNTEIKVSFEHPELLTVTYPKYNNEWVVTASSNGDLYDQFGKYYYALYWEESNAIDVDFSEGFYVTKDNAIEFLKKN